MHIREAKNSDLQSIRSIMNDAIIKTTSIYDYEPRTEEYVENWLAKKQADGMPVLVAEVNNESVAFGSYGIFRAWDAYRFSVEHSIYVQEKFQRLGIGKELLIALIDKARKSGYHTMIAGIDAGNQKSYDLHNKLGFIEAGRFRQVGYKFNRWLDLVFMQLMLEKGE